MKALALIPARAGSKRVPGKNLRELGGKPLIAWTISAALDSGHFADVLVSTDDESIAEVAVHFGASAPWLRPAEFATDTATSVDVALHALDRYCDESGSVDCLTLLQPTSPFRRASDIRAAIRLFEDSQCAQRVVSLCQAAVKPAWLFVPNGESVKPLLGWDALVGAEEYQSAYQLNGAIYITPPELLRSTRSFIGSEFIPYVMDGPSATVDIDTEADWRYAEAVLESAIS